MHAQCIWTTQLSRLLGNHWQVLYTGEQGDTKQWMKALSSALISGEGKLSSMQKCLFWVMKYKQKKKVCLFLKIKLNHQLYCDRTVSHFMKKIADYWSKEEMDVPNKLVLECTHCGKVNYWCCFEHICIFPLIPRLKEILLDLNI